MTEQMDKLPPPADGEITLIPEVPVALRDPVISEEAALDAVQRQGSVMCSKKAVSDLAAIGVHVMGAGSLKVQRGQVFISQQRLNQALILLMDELQRLTKGNDKKKTAKLAQIAQSLGYLTARLTDSQSLMVAIERLHHPGGQAIEEILPTNDCFLPGEAKGGGTSIVAKEVHLHQHNNGGK